MHENGAEMKLLKRIARENDVPWQEVERIYKEFQVPAERLGVFHMREA